MEMCYDFNKLYVFQAKKIESLYDVNLVKIRRRRHPQGRSGHRIAVSETSVYTFGGYNPNADVIEYEYQDIPQEAELFREIWKYNLCRKEWTEVKVDKQTFPAELASVTLQKLGNYMSVHGGTGIPFGVTSSNDTYVARFPKCDLQRLNTTGTLPCPMYGQASAIDVKNKLMYIVGGTTGLHFSMDVHCLDFNSLVWSKLSQDFSEVPEGRYRHEIALFDSKLIVFGGGTTERVFDFVCLPVFDLKSQTWDTMWTKGYRKSRTTPPRFPNSRRCHTGTLVPAEEGRDAEYIICGGFDGTYALSDVWSLNLRTNQWLQWKSALPYKVYFHDAGLTPHGQLVIFGGIISYSGSEMDPSICYRTNQVLTCWVKLPKLSEMAWEAVLHYAPALRRMPPNELLRLGIPPTFADRML